VIGFLVAGLTAFYMFRLLIITFLGEPQSKEKYDHCHESPIQMTIPLIVLAILSFFAFFSLNPFGADSGWIMQMMKTPESLLKGTKGLFYHIVDREEYTELLHHAHYPAMFLSLAVAGIGILSAYVLYYWKKIDVEKLTEKIKPIYNFSLNKWYFDELYDATAVAFTMGMSRLSAWIDNVIVDGVVNGSATITRWVSFGSGKFDNIVVDGFVNFTAGVVGFFGLVFRKFQTGKIQTYIAFLVFGMIVLYFIFR